MTKEWEILLQWKDGSTAWETLKDIKDSYPVQIAEYVHLQGISDKVAFAWWVLHVFGENFCRKARMVAGGHMASTPSSLTHSSVVL
jgi:hypothetical protein